MIDLTWKLFSQTGNIETYLLYKQLADDKAHGEFRPRENEEDLPIESNF